MNRIILLLIIGLTIGSCNSNVEECEPVSEPQCVGAEEITSTETDFLILDKGLQENGYADGIKINEEWEASASLYIVLDSIYGFSLITYWTDLLDSNYLLTGEVLGFGLFSNIKENTCYFLSSTESSQDSIECSYRVNHGDINILTYELDTNADNRLEVIEYDEENSVFRGRLKASFITTNPLLPEFPEKVQFFNVDIVIGE